MDRFDFSEEDHKALEQLLEYAKSPINCNNCKYCKGRELTIEAIEHTINLVNILRDRINELEEVHICDAKMVDEAVILQRKLYKLEDNKDLEQKKLAAELTRITAEQIKTDHRNYTENGVKALYKEWLDIITKEE